MEAALPPQGIPLHPAGVSPLRLHGRLPHRPLALPLVLRLLHHRARQHAVRRFPELRQPLDQDRQPPAPLEHVLLHDNFCPAFCRVFAGPGGDAPRGEEGIGAAPDHDFYAGGGEHGGRRGDVGALLQPPVRHGADDPRRGCLVSQRGVGLVRRRQTARRPGCRDAGRSRMVDDRRGHHVLLERRRRKRHPLPRGTSAHPGRAV